MSRVKPQKNAIAHIPVRRDVPEGWSLSTVGECFFDIRNGTTASQNKQKRGVPVSRIETIQDGRFDLDRLRHIEKASAELLNVFAYKTGDIALSHINSFEHVGKTAIYEGKPKSLIHGMNLLRLRLGHEHLFTKYLYLFMQTDYFRWQVRDRVLHAVNQVSINQRSLSQVSVLLAPTREQKRIVAKVEQLLARINAARERLAKVPAILKRFRQSVLAAACSGRLTADWRDRHGEVDSVDEILKRLEKRRVDEATTPKQKNRLKEIYSYREKEDPRLIPENWTYVALDKLCGSFQYGTSRKSQSSGKVPVLRMGNIQDGHIDWNNLVYTSDDSEIQKYRLNSGSVLFNRTNSPELVGKTGIYRGEQPAVFAGYLIRINNFDDLNSEYLNYCLNSNHAKEFCLRVKTDGVSQSNINAQKLGKFEVPFCSLEEQQEIVRRLGALFRFADQIEARYQKAKAHTEKLTQAILSKAFRGDLVRKKSAPRSRNCRAEEDIGHRPKRQRLKPNLPSRWIRLKAPKEYQRILIRLRMDQQPLKSATKGPL
jgi:type I restriction enzyme S subunit